MQKLTGRKTELSLFGKIIASERSEFVAVYGRRRVGKTFLIRAAFKGLFSFEIAGLANESLNQQLTNFNLEFQKQAKPQQHKNAENWLETFSMLSGYLDSVKTKKKVVFIDELPWFDTKRSGFIQGLEHFWNAWASKRGDIILIVCGSATSWMLTKLINNKGGLHNRITQKMRIEPFTLQECEKYLNSRNINIDKYQIIQLYMALGGIPFYWDAVEKGQSAMQNINRICFSENGILKSEFLNLYRSLFNNYEKHLDIVKTLAKKTVGLTREQIIKLSGLPDAGSTTRLLVELQESGFIRKYTPFGRKNRNSLFQLVDFYTLFYLKFIHDENENSNWINAIDTPKYRAWSGYAYEQICFYHIQQIKNALGIGSVNTSISSWRSSSDSSNRVQIDLLIDRRDQVINLCEAKFSVNPFVISKKYADELRNKAGTFIRETGTKKSVFLTMITTYGVQQNINSIGLLQNELVMEDLF